MSKDKPVNIGTAGAGSATHMTLARFNAATGAKFEHVPYRGGGALVPDLLSGSITGAMTEVSTALPHHGDKVRIIGVASAQRSPKAPDAATMIEQGVKDFTAASYVGILAPAATPAEIVKALEGALIKALDQQGDAGEVPQHRRRAGAGRADDLEGLRRLHQARIRARRARPRRSPG